jgi:hypothetical protein
VAIQFTERSVGQEFVECSDQWSELAKDRVDVSEVEYVGYARGDLARAMERVRWMDEKVASGALHDQVAREAVVREAYRTMLPVRLVVPWFVGHCSSMRAWELLIFDGRVA